MRITILPLLDKRLCHLGFLMGEHRLKVLAWVENALSAQEIGQMYLAIDPPSCF